MTELTFAEVKAILDEIETSSPNAGKLELIAEAYKRGYAAAAEQMKERE